MTKEVIKIGPVELTESEAQKAYDADLYLCTSSAVYQIKHHENTGFYGKKIIVCKGIAARGRFHLLTASAVNSLIGQKCIVE